MAKKFKIAVNPTFTADVSIPRVAGEPIVVPFTFKVLGRKELGKLMDKWKDDTEVLINKLNEMGEDINSEYSVELIMESEKNKIKDIVVGWGFEDEFNDSCIETLLDTSINVIDSIMSSYNDAYAKANLGNSK